MNFNRVVEIITEKGYFAEQSVQKGLNCIIISKNEDDAIKAVLYLRDYIDMKDDETVADAMIERFENSEAPDESALMSQIDSKENRIIVPCLRPIGTRDDGAVSSKFLDIELYYRLLIKLNGEFSASTVVTEDLADALELTKLELYEEANKNALEYGKFDKFMGILNVLSYKDGIPFGAGVITNTQWLYDVYDEIGEFFILPSSINEVIVIPDDGMVKANDLKDMVDAVNNDSNAMDSDEILSYSVYRFDGAELSVAS